MKYYVVIAKCGHVGNGKYIDIEFPVVAENGSLAAKKILNRSKVKKHLKNAITNVKEVMKDEYLYYVNQNSKDEYLHSHCSKEFDITNYEVKNLESREKSKKIEFNSRKERIEYIFRRNNLRYSFYYEMEY